MKLNVILDTSNIWQQVAATIIVSQPIHGQWNVTVLSRTVNPGIVGFLCNVVVGPVEIDLVGLGWKAVV